MLNIESCPVKVHLNGSTLRSREELLLPTLSRAQIQDCSNHGLEACHPILLHAVVFLVVTSSLGCLSKPRRELEYWTGGDGRRSIAFAGSYLAEPCMAPRPLGSFSSPPPPMLQRVRIASEMSQMPRDLVDSTGPSGDYPSLTLQLDRDQAGSSVPTER